MAKKKKSSMAKRAWKLLRLSLLSVRTGRAFKQKLILDLRPFLKRLGHSNSRSRHLHILHREFSLDESPTFNFHRPASMRHLRIPCINAPAVDDDLDGGLNFFDGEHERCEIDSREDESGDPSMKEGSGEEGIDLKAEEFIANFYKQIKLQRQISLLQYNEMLQRDMD